VTNGVPSLTVLVARPHPHPCLTMSSDYEFSDDEEYNDYDDDEENMDIEDGMFTLSSPLAYSSL
jgi:hypothetical protein